MENKASKVIAQNQHHECELFGGTRQQEAAESQYKWNNCSKNPEHRNFISAQVFKNIHLPKVQKARHREKLKSCIDLTVRLRVFYTSTKRPDDDEFSHGRGSDRLRTGTGFIENVSRPEYYQPCPCLEHGGRLAKKQWRFLVHTAHHVVFNTEEAMETKVDLFLDDENCDRDGRMKSVWGLRVDWCLPDRDRCSMLCVTCDEELGEMIQSAWRCYDDAERLTKDLDLSGLDSLLSGTKSRSRSSPLALIVSHPHGQPKRITMGEVREEGNLCVNYTVPTCAGSSGAPVFRFRCNSSHWFEDITLFPVHSGSFKEITGHEDQLNFGFDYWYCNKSR